LFLVILECNYVSHFKTTYIRSWDTKQATPLFLCLQKCLHNTKTIAQLVRYLLVLPVFKCTTKGLIRSHHCCFFDIPVRVSGTQSTPIGHYLIFTRSLIHSCSTIKNGSSQTYLFSEIVAHQKNTLYNC
jgi:hypothetical protein